MEPVDRYLRTSLRTDRTGARVIARDEHTLILYHQPEWGDAHTCRLRARFPDCEVTMRSNTSSDSGFVVILRRHEHPWARLWASLLALALALVAYAAVRLHRGPGGSAGEGWNARTI